MRTTIIASFVLASAAPLGAQVSTPMPAATVVQSGRFKQLGDSLTPGASRTAQLGKAPGMTYAVTHRDSTGGIEVHRDWTDVFVVETGSATILTGGTLTGAAETTPGEWRGGTVSGGTHTAVKVGDLVIIPAGTPHQMILKPGEQITYLAFKVAAPK